MARKEYKGGVLYFNPGSATGTFPASSKTFGIITAGKEMAGEILKV
jgi:predicted phosphodiesterase